MTGQDNATSNTLTEAHRALTRVWPGETASAAAFVAYYQHGAVVYAAVAEIDVDHRQEAIWWAGECRRLADVYAAEVPPVPADSSGDVPAAGPG